MSKLILEKSLPTNWTITDLENILSKLDTGSRPTGGVSGITDGIPSIGGEHLEYNGSFNLENIRFIPKKFYEQMTRGHIQHNDILIVKDGATTGKTSFINQTFPFKKSAVNEHVFILRGIGNIIFQQYLFYYLFSSESQKIIKRKISGSAQGGINTSFIKNFPLPLPPLAEQKRIVAKIEELFSKIDSVMISINKVKLQLNQYRKSIINASLEGTLFGYMRQEKPLFEIIDSLGQGWSPRCENHPSISDNDWAVIKTTSIQPMKFDDKQNKKLPTSLEPRKHLELKEGDLLITRAGPRTRVGIACLVRKTRKRLILCDKAYRIQCKKNLIEPSFLEIVLNSFYMSKEIERLKTGISDSGLNITQARFTKLIIPYFSLNEQKNIVNNLERTLSRIDSQVISITNVLKQIPIQRNSILKQAFEGKLVPQDPNDESAEILLEKIKLEKEKLIKTTITKSRRMKNVK